MISKYWTTFTLILVLVLFVLLIDIPRLPKWIPFSQWFTKQKIHFGLDLQGGTELIYETDTSQIPEAERALAVEAARDLIERRVNIFGVTEPVIQTVKTEDGWRLMVSLPGIKNVAEAIKMIGETPVLEFKEQAQPKEITPEEKKEIEEYNKKAKKLAQDVLKNALQLGSDFSILAETYSEDLGSKKQSGDLGWFKKGEMVSTFEEAVFNKLRLNEITKELVETPFGFHIIKKTGERKNDQGETEVRASHILIRTKSEEEIKELAGQWVYTGLTGKQLKTARLVFNPETNEPEVSLEFNNEGAKLFADITSRNIGKQVAIFLDGLPISAPVVREAITGGKAVITGKFSVPEAKELAQRLSAGALPVPIKLISQQNIGASLGMIGVEKSFIAGIIGFLLVVIFMIFFYGRYGFVAAVALLIYILITLAIFKLIPVILTLAGIAGFIISIGMAVDANVLIFERIKDERARGRAGFTLIEDSFRHAWTAIRDSNITTLISCFILYQFGTGLVKGFGLTLGIGVLVSMFTAIVVTKTILRLTNLD